MNLCSALTVASLRSQDCLDSLKKRHRQSIKLLEIEVKLLNLIISTDGMIPGIKQKIDEGHGQTLWLLL